MFVGVLVVSVDSDQWFVLASGFFAFVGGHSVSTARVPDSDNDHWQYDLLLCELFWIQFGIVPKDS